MKKLGAILIALVLLLTACLPGYAVSADCATMRNAELSAFTDGNGHIYISGLGTPVNTTPAAEIVSIDAYRILFYAQESAAAGIPATRLISLTLDTLAETVVTDDAADACAVGDDAYFISAADARMVYRQALDTGLTVPALQSAEAVERLYAASEGVVAVLTGGESAYVIGEAGYSAYNREIASSYAVYEGFDLYTTADGSLYAHTGADSILLDTGVKAWAVLQDSVYYLTQNSGLLSLKCYDPEAGLWRVILPLCRDMQPQLTASQTLLFMLSQDNSVYTVDTQTGVMSLYVTLPQPESFKLENGAAVESYRIEAVSGQLNVLGMVRQAESAPAFTFVQYAEQPVQAMQSSYRLLTAYTVRDEDTVAMLLQPAEQYSLLQYGSRGDAVSAIQEPLLRLGYYDYIVDGIYGWRTEDAIEILQADLGLEVTGAADAELQKLILGGTLSAYDPYRGIAFGESGLRVQTMQQRLRDLGYLADSADGIYGSRTMAAVSLFQREHNLRETGAADAAMLKLLYSDAAGACSVYIELVKGDSGYRVRELNSRLKALYYLDGRVGSNYTSTTVSAVRKFQAEAGLKQTGIATPEVQKALFAKKAPENPDYITLRKGDDNARVKQLQQRLNELGYNAGKADGSYGKNTVDAVKLFQRVVGLKATGTADVDTLKRLFAKDAPEYTEPKYIGAPVISIESYVSVENGLYTVDDALDTVLLSWYVDGEVASYDVKITDESGAVWMDETNVSFEMMSLPVEGISAGMVYTLNVTAHPADTRFDSDTSAYLRFTRAKPQEIPGITSLVILPGGSYESADGYIIFDGDASIVWSAAGNVYGYGWRVTDAAGYTAAGYESDSISGTDSVELRAADFTPGDIYTLTVDAFASADAAEPVTQTLRFAFVQAKQEETVPEETQPPQEETAPPEETVPPEEPINVISDLVILPVADYAMTEQCFLLTGDSHFQWQVNGTAYGYSYAVTAEDGSIVPGYENAMTSGEGLALIEADFALDHNYWLTVYAYASENDETPLMAAIPFCYPSDMNMPEGGDVVDEPVVDRTALYQEFYSTNYAGGEGVVLADVTQDGQDELIVVQFGEYEVYGYVFTERDGIVTQIDQTCITTGHGGVCGWYLIPHGASWALVEETDLMWQGYGEAYFMAYTLNEYGDRIQISSGWINDQEAACVDADGRLLDNVIADYGNMLGEVIAPGYVLYRSGSLCGMPMSMLYMVVQDTLFGDAGIIGGGVSEVENVGYTDGSDESVDDSYEEETYDDGADEFFDDVNDGELFDESSDEFIDKSSDEETPDDGTDDVTDESAGDDGADKSPELDEPDGQGMIALMALTYDDLGYIVSGLNWFETPDYPDIWYANGYYDTGSGDVSVFFDFYGTPGDGSAYPATMTVMDFDGISAWVTPKLRTGMTYAEICTLEWESIDGLYDDGMGGGIATGYPEQGCMMSMMFDGTGEGAKLTSVTVSFFE